jgi:CubicO group peptidase (beta-lactamase class C family)
MFYIASVTKPFVALTTVLLDRDGVMKLDASLADVLPEARLGAGLDPSAITVRHLLTHTHRVAEGPLTYRAAMGEIERSAMLRVLTEHRPEPADVTYRYSNFGYTLLSLAIDRVARKPWQDVVAERVLAPMALKSTAMRLSTIPASRLAMPYDVEPVGLARLAYGKQDSNMHAAGGMLSSTSDLARFVAMIMDGGVVDGRRVFPAEAIAETQKIQAKFTSKFGASERFGYGLGWNFATLDGETIAHHGGTFPGFSTSVSYMPSRRLGLIILGNGGFSDPIQNLLMPYIYALLTGNETAAARYPPQFQQMPRLAAEARKQLAAERARRAARPQTTALPLDRYVGRFVNEVLGSIETTLRDGRIHARHGVLESVTEVYDGTRNMLRVEFVPNNGTVMEFVAEDGRVTGIRYSGRVFARVK